MTETPTRRGTIITLSRRRVVIRDDTQTFQGITSTINRELAVGDVVDFEVRGEEAFVTEIQPRRNLLERSYHGERRALAANLDHLLIVIASQPVVDPVNIDRVLVAAHQQEIPCSIIANKSDLGTETIEPFFAIYRTLNIPLHLTSAQSTQGIEELKTFLASPTLKAVALAGLSGVGKSSILNCLIPDAQRKTAQVSQRTGQGRQTTSQAVAYHYQRGEISPLTIIDLPGIQRFGIEHLTAEQVRTAFPEIAEHGARCRFSNCSHLLEEECGVQDALQSGEIAPSRFASYVRILDEIAEAASW